MFKANELSFIKELKTVVGPKTIIISWLKNFDITKSHPFGGNQKWWQTHSKVWKYFPIGVSQNQLKNLIFFFKFLFSIYKLASPVKFTLQPTFRHIDKVT